MMFVSFLTFLKSLVLCVEPLSVSVFSHLSKRIFFLKDIPHQAPLKALSLPSHYSPIDQPHKLSSLPTLDRNFQAVLYSAWTNAHFLVILCHHRMLATSAEYCREN
jgi:hypothetical protein